MTKIPEMPKFKAVIKENIEVRIPNSKYHRNYVYSVKNMDEAKKRAKELEDEAREKWEKEYNKERLVAEHNQFVYDQMRKMAEYLKKQLWHDTREVGKDSETVKIKKQIKEQIQGILLGTHMLDWHQSYVDNSTYYTYEETDKPRLTGRE